MGIRFAKSIKLGDFLKLNISKSGVSATIGKKGASINIGGKGTYLNLSPSAVGISGTGMSYRKKIGGLSGLLKKITGKDDDKTEEVIEQNEKQPVAQIEEKDESNVIDEYNEAIEAQCNIHKYADKILSENELKQAIENLQEESVKDLYNQALTGDEDSIESLVGSVLNNLDLDYEVKANYELEDDILYVDLDLPEIEDFSDEYPVISNKKVVTKKKTSSQFRQEYAQTVISLGLYLTTEFFNVSSYIKQIVLSAFTSRRNNVGDLVDEYLYSVKYTRDGFKDVDLSKVDDAYDFLLKFENRINMSSTGLFKAIKPYEMETVVKTNSMIDDVVAGLKSLGYKSEDINTVLPKLAEQAFETSGEYLKYALSLINNK